MQNFTQWFEANHAEDLKEQKGDKKKKFKLRVHHGKLKLALNVEGEPVAVEENAKK